MDEPVNKGKLVLFDQWELLKRKQDKDGTTPKVKDEFSRDSNPKGYAPSLANAQLAIHKLGIVFRLDTFRQRIITEGWPPELGEAPEKIELVVRKLVIDRCEFDPEPRHTRDAIELIAMENAFDPVRDYLDGLKWDGVPRLDTWVTDYLGAEDDPLTRAIGRAVLTGAVRRARRPGCKFDGVMVLEGPQGGGKSTALKILAGGDEYFSDEIAADVPYKEQQELLQGKWIIELPELVGLSNTQVGRLKQFISKTHDRGRPAFARSVAELPRRCILIGTTNDAQYLRDTTGNRRFWSVVTGKIDLPGLKEVRDQLWAEAAAAEPDAPDPITLPENLWGEAAKRQAERVAGDLWDEILQPALSGVATEVDGELRITAQTVFEKVLKMDPRLVHRRDTVRLADCLRRLGWVGPKAMRIDGALVKGYSREAGMAP